MSETEVNPRRFFIRVDAEGALTGEYDSIYGEPSESQIEGMFEVSQAVFAEMSEFQGLRRFIDGKVVEYTPPPPPPVVPSEISRRQFFQQLAVSGIISNAEAIAALAQGVIPTPLQVLVDQLPTEDDKFNAQMFIIGAATFQRGHPLVDMVRVLLGWTEEQADQFFIDAYKL